MSESQQRPGTTWASADAAAAAGARPAADAAEIEVSFVMPCLNEAETLEGCIRAAQRCIEENGLSAEIVIADNGSTDGSQEIAERCGARVVSIREKGYGSALSGGFSAARGRYLIMGDSDLSYDFGEGMKFVEKLREGHDLVMGSRFLGRIEPGAMPWKHRWIGNPVLSWLGRTLFRTNISDFHCGLRAMTKETFERLNLRTTGMEFASEVVVKASVQNLRVTEVPIVLHPDGRSRPPHLRSWRDGWRHLRFLLCLSPRWTLFIPGAVLSSLGAVAMLLLWLGPLRLGSVTFNVHTMLVASLVVLVGYQAMTTALAARIFAVEEEIGPPAPWIQSAVRFVNLERGLLIGIALVLVGAGIIGSVAYEWGREGFRSLEPTQTLPSVVIGATLVAMGIQTLLMSFLYSMFGIQRRR